MTPQSHCTVVENERLKASSVSSESICSEVERAVASRAPGVHYAIEIRALSASRLTATLIVEGRTLPVQNFAVMDQNLSEGSIKQFANSLAGVVANATKS